MQFRRLRGVSIFALAAAIAGSAASCSRTEFTPRPSTARQAPEASSTEVLVRLKKDAKPATGADLGEPFAAVPIRYISKELRMASLRLKPDWSVPQALGYINKERSALIERAQANHKVTWRGSLNDPGYPLQWALSNSSAAASGGTSSIRAPEAWGLASAQPSAAASSVVIAIVDGGVDVRHPDLAANIFSFAGEIAGNGIDDDGNGYADDVNGWSTVQKNGQIPADFHGTHVAGIASAVGGNGQGIVGVSYAGPIAAKILAVSLEEATTDKVLEAYGYVLAQKKLWIQTNGKKGANVVATNSSFGVDYARCQDGDYPLWDEMYDALGAAGILSAAAAPNLELDVDVDGDVPTGCVSKYLVKVTNTNMAGEREYESGYGARSIDLGAPGTEILSTLPGGEYDYLTGTSMSTPHVSGAIGFLYEVASIDLWAQVAQNPGRAALIVKEALLRGVDANPSLTGLSSTGGKLNLSNSARIISGWKLTQ